MSALLLRPGPPRSVMSVTLPRLNLSLSRVVGSPSPVSMFLPRMRVLRSPVSGTLPWMSRILMTRMCFMLRLSALRRTVIVTLPLSMPLLPPLSGTLPGMKC